MSTLVITSHDVQRLLSQVGLDRLMDTLIDRLTQDLHSFGEGHTEVPKRDGFHYLYPRPGLVEWMPTMIREKAVVIKTVGYHPRNPELAGLPSVLGNITMYDVLTGSLLAIMDGVIPTALRTGAASAVASQVLARKKSPVLGMIGCGMQAVTQVHAVSRVATIERVLAFDRDVDSASSLAARLAFTGLPVELATIEEIEEVSDILCTATSVGPGEGPILTGERLQKHVHINAVGSDLAGKTELPLELLRRSLVVPDFLEQALEEGECQQLERGEIGPSLTDVLRSPEAYESYRDETTLFDSTGFALEDKVVMEVMLEMCAELELGSHLDIECKAGDPKDPYIGVAREVPSLLGAE
jgi:ornithine cyclodeaminase/alanine dehydrogenase-like protein (mu-crystallin family)